MKADGWSDQGLPPRIFDVRNGHEMDVIRLEDLVCDQKPFGPQDELGSVGATPLAPTGDPRSGRGHASRSASHNVSARPLDDHDLGDMD